MAKEIEEAKEKIQKIEEKLKTLPEDHADRPFLKKRLESLDAQLTVLLQERLSQRQGAMPPGPPQRRSGAAPCCSLSGASRRSSIALHSPGRRRLLICQLSCVHA